MGIRKMGRIKNIKRIGTRFEVINGKALQTAGGLRKINLKINDNGVIVSRKKSMAMKSLNQRRLNKGSRSMMGGAGKEKFKVNYNVLTKAINTPQNLTKKEKGLIDLYKGFGNSSQQPYYNKLKQAIRRMETYERTLKQTAQPVAAPAQPPTPQATATTPAQPPPPRSPPPLPATSEGTSSNTNFSHFKTNYGNRLKEHENMDHQIKNLQRSSEDLKSEINSLDKQIKLNDASLGKTQEALIDVNKQIEQITETTATKEDEYQKVLIEINEKIETNKKGIATQQKQIDAEEGKLTILRDELGKILGQDIQNGNDDFNKYLEEETTSLSRAKELNTQLISQIKKLEGKRDQQRQDLETKKSENTQLTQQLSRKRDELKELTRRVRE